MKTNNIPILEINEENNVRSNINFSNEINNNNNNINNYLSQINGIFEFYVNPLRNK